MAFFLALTFLSLLTSPLVIHLIDDAKEVTSLMDKSEQEKKTEEFEKDIELELRNHYKEFSFQEAHQTKNYNDANSLHYFLELAKINTPPPEALL